MERGPHLHHLLQLPDGDALLDQRLSSNPHRLHTDLRPSAVLLGHAHPTDPVEEVQALEVEPLRALRFPRHNELLRHTAMGDLQRRQLILGPDDGPLGPRPRGLPEAGLEELGELIASKPSRNYGTTQIISLEWDDDNHLEMM